MSGYSAVKLRRVVGLVLFGALAVILSSCSFESHELGGFRIDDNFRLRTGETITGDQLLVGSRIELASGSRVDGDLTAFGERVSLDATVDGDVTVFADDLLIGDATRITGDLTYCTNSALRRDGAQIGGTVREECEEGGRATFDRIFGDGGGWHPNVVVRFLGAIGRALFLGAAAALGTIVFPRAFGRMSESVEQAPLRTGAIGCLTIVAAVGLTAVYAVSLIFIVPLLLLPLVLIGWLVLGVALLVGWTALALPVGRWIVRRIGQESPPPLVAAAAGGLALGFGVAIWDLFWFTGWIGSLATGILGAIGLGAVILTRLGRRAYPLAAAEDAPPVQG